MGVFVVDKRNDTIRSKSGFMEKYRNMIVIPKS